MVYMGELENHINESPDEQKVVASIASERKYALDDERLSLRGLVLKYIQFSC